MTHHLVVVSDLHLASPGPLSNFDAGDALAAFVNQHTSRQTTLVLAGDAFDFLQVEERTSSLDGALMPGLIQTTLGALDATPWGRRLFNALGALLESGGTCVILPGNHDPEVAHPAFSKELLARIHRPPNDPGLVVHTKGPWRTMVGDREVIVGHGHRGDPWNDITPEVVEAALRGEVSPLPPGSRLVTEVLNVFKDARDADGAQRFPFVDLLKPEVPAVPLLLLYLDKKLAMKHLPRALGLTAEKLGRHLVKALQAGGTLGPTDGHLSGEPADELAQALAPNYTEAERMNPNRCADELEDWLEGGDEGGVAGTLAAHGGMRARMLRAFLHAASDYGRFFTREHLSADDRRIVKEYLPSDAPKRVVIAGHTHAARLREVSPDHIYINTGTWTDLMKFPSQRDEGFLMNLVNRAASIFKDETYKEWIDALERRDVPRRKILTYADITPDAVQLGEFRS